MKVKKNLRRKKNPPSPNESNFPIIPVMATFLLLAGAGVFIYWDRKRRSMPQNRAQLTTNFTPQQYRTQIQAPNYQRTNLDSNGAPTWVSRDRGNQQIDRWINDPSYWSSNESNRTDQADRGGQNNQTGQSTLFYVATAVDPSVTIGPVIKQTIETALAAIPGFDQELTRRAAEINLNVSESISLSTPARNIRNALNNPNKKIVVVGINTTALGIEVFGPNGSLIGSAERFWNQENNPTSEEALSAVAEIRPLLA